MTILAYHSISSRDHPLAIEPDEFARQLDALARYEVLTLGEYTQRTMTGVSTRRCCALTFDDGFRDFAEVATGMLVERGYPATVFVAPGLAGSTLTVDYARTAEPLDWPVMTWSEVLAVAAEGMEVGSHSVSHRRLTEIDLDDMKKEICESKRLLEDALDTPVRSFCYPRGAHTPAVVSAVAEAGYECAVVTPRAARHASDRYTLARMGIYRRDDQKRFRLKLSSAGNLFRSARHLVGSE